MISPTVLPRLQRTFGAADPSVEGWLLFDFRGINPIMAAVVGPEVVGSRRSFAYLPAQGTPTALIHAIDAELWRSWPEEWHKRTWVWRDDLRGDLSALVGGRQVAVGYSPLGDVPYADYVPAGMLEFIRDCGASPVTSAELVSRFCSVWSEPGLAAHLRAAEVIREIGLRAISMAGERARTASPATEWEVARFILDAFDRAGLETESVPSVCYGANASRNHYAPTPGESSSIVPGALLLVDLWAKEPGGIYADQTWMASVGPPSERGTALWNAVRESRDAALDLLRERMVAGKPVSGAEVDRVGKEVIRRHGLVQYVECRTGHSIDSYGLHGYGPTIDDTESFDHRLLIPGVGFSVEPGIYVPGEIGVRSEVNVHVEEDGPRVSPGHYQRELIVV